MAIWPADSDDVEDEEPYFYLERRPGMQPRSIASVRGAFPILGIVPILAPLEGAEGILADQYVRNNVSGRLSSRHFRNHLRLLEEEGALDDFFGFANKWLKDISLTDLSAHAEAQTGRALDVYYAEAGSRIPKELRWAGDGMQIWVQILYHVFVTDGFDTVILDEPEVYLHPDLQRELVHLLESTGRQIIMATHSSEIAAEVSPSDLVLVDKTRARASRARSADVEARIGSALGSQFNLRLAKALRSKVALFVEGNDVSLLRQVFRVLGFTNLAAERGVSVIELGGYSNWIHVEPFVWLVREFLPDAVSPYVVLDRDYRSNEAIDLLEAEFASHNIPAHVWRRKEVESYLLTSTTLARAAGIEISEAEALIASAAGTLEDEVFGNLVSQALQEQAGGSQHYKRIASEVRANFDSRWPSTEFQWQCVPPKHLLAGVNQQLQGSGRKAVSFRALARGLRAGDVPEEMSDVFAPIEQDSSA